MATILSIADTIECGKASKYLAANYVSKQGLFGGSVVKPNLPVQIAFVTDALDWGNTGGAQTTASIRTVANYLIWLCGRFQLEAQRIINGAGGGTVAPTAAGVASPNPLDFVVSAISDIVTGATTATITQFIGYNIEFARNGLIQYTTNPGDGSTYYSWSKSTGVITFSVALQAGEQIRISPSL